MLCCDINLSGLEVETPYVSRDAVCWYLGAGSVYSLLGYIFYNWKIRCTWCIELSTLFVSHVDVLNIHKLLDSCTNLFLPAVRWKTLQWRLFLFNIYPCKCTFVWDGGCEDLASA